MSKFHKIKYKNLSGEEVARGYSVAIKKELVESLKLEDKDLIIEVIDKKIVIREVKDEKNK